MEIKAKYGKVIRTRRAVSVNTEGLSKKPGANKAVIASGNKRPRKVNAKRPRRKIPERLERKSLSSKSP